MTTSRSWPPAAPANGRANPSVAGPLGPGGQQETSARALKNPQARHRGPMTEPMVTVFSPVAGGWIVMGFLRYRRGGRGQKGPWRGQEVWILPGHEREWAAGAPRSVSSDPG